MGINRACRLGSGLFGAPRNDTALAFLGRVLRPWPGLGGRNLFILEVYGLDLPGEGKVQAVMACHISLGSTSLM